MDGGEHAVDQRNFSKQVCWSMEELGASQGVLAYKHKERSVRDRNIQQQWGENEAFGEDCSW